MYGEKVFDFIYENFQQKEVWKAIDLEYNKQISLLTTVNV
jgi:hypothetical protein